jgi:hypothetical protein
LKERLRLPLALAICATVLLACGGFGSVIRQFGETRVETVSLGDLAGVWTAKSGETDMTIELTATGIYTITGAMTGEYAGSGTWSVAKGILILRPNICKPLRPCERRTGWYVYTDDRKLYGIYGGVDIDPDYWPYWERVQ